jgi:YD repeat-containing protein
MQEQWSNGQWAGVNRDTFTYDANGNMLTYLLEDWSNGQWMFHQRSTFTYDANGRMLSDLFEWANGVWVYPSRITYTYDVDGKMLASLGERWNGQWMNGSPGSGQWEISTRGTNTYDAQGRMLSWLYEIWDGHWTKYRYNAYTYDANGNKLTDLWEEWSWSTGQLVDGSRWTFMYDAQGSVTSAWHDTWLKSSWTPTDTPFFTVVDSAANDYYLGFGYNFTFMRKLILTGVVSEGGGGPATYSLSQNYPNPFNPSTMIRYGLPNRSHVMLTIFNTLGQQVALLENGEQEAGYHEVKFDGSGLSSGVYFYRMEVRPLDSAIGRDSKRGAGSFVQTLKLVLLK